LVTDEFTECPLSGHRLCFLDVRELMRRQRTNGLAQHLAIKPFLALEVVIHGRLIDASLSRERTNARRVIAAFSEQPYRRPQNAVAGKI
jgi:hypothetical protein